MALILGQVLVLAAALAAPLEIEVRARAVAPGEPVRFIVRSEASLASLEARFLGHPLVFSKLPGRGEEAQRRWSAWSSVPLGTSPTETVVEVRGRTTEGQEALGLLVVEVIARDYPEERLEVASRFVQPSAEALRKIEADREKLNRVYARRGTPRHREGVFLRPVPGRPTSIFGTRRFFNGEARDPHPGLDLEAATGTEVRASGDGEVVLAQDLYYAGNTVIIDHGQGLFTIYAHLSRIDAVEGQPIARGAVLGRSGATGRVTGPHLHWGAKFGAEPFDPRALLDAKLFAPSKSVR